MKTAGLWVPIVLCSAAIFAISQHVEIIKLFPWIPNETKEMVGHLGLYFLLGFFLARYLFGMGVGGFTAFVLTVNLSAMLGFYDEFHQSFVAGRGVQLYDIIMDLAGGAAGGLAYLVWAGARWLAVKSARQREAKLDRLVRHAAAAATVFVFILVPGAICSVLITDYVRALATDGPAAAERVLDRYLRPDQPAAGAVDLAVPANPTGLIPASKSAQHTISAEAAGQFALVADMLSRTAKRGSQPAEALSFVTTDAELDQSAQVTGGQPLSGSGDSGRK
ncbi:MAG: VanZ family protein [Desulfomonile sp.]|nr:VanZ family protein [Desulfomonile sp.]